MLHYKYLRPYLMTGATWDSWHVHPQAAPRPPAEDGITMLTGKKDKIGGAGPAIPDFLRVEPDEQTKRMQEVKGKLVSALQPTPDMISKIGQDPTLLAGGEHAMPCRCRISSQM